MKIELGSRVRDTHTGFEGIAVAVTHWEHGCSRYGIQPTNLDKGKMREIEWVDEQRVEVVEALKDAKAPRKVGGPPVRGQETG